METTCGQPGTSPCTTSSLRSVCASTARTHGRAICRARAARACHRGDKCTALASCLKFTTARLCTLPLPYQLHEQARTSRRAPGRPSTHPPAASRRRACAASPHPPGSAAALAQPASRPASCMNTGMSECSSTDSVRHTIIGAQHSHSHALTPTRGQGLMTAQQHHHRLLQGGHECIHSACIHVPAP